MSNRLKDNTRFETREASKKEARVFYCIKARSLLLESSPSRLLRHHHLHKLFVVHFTIAINIRFSNHLVDFFVRRFHQSGPS